MPIGRGLNYASARDSVRLFGRRVRCAVGRAFDPGGRPATPSRVDSGSRPAKSVGQLGVRFVARERVPIGRGDAAVVADVLCRRFVLAVMAPLGRRVQVP